MKSGGANCRDEDRFAHMMRAIGRIKEQLDGLVRSMMREGDNRTELIIYNLQVLGEAANNVSDAAWPHIQRLTSKDGLDLGTGLSMITQTSILTLYGMRPRMNCQILKQR